MINDWLKHLKQVESYKEKKLIITKLVKRYEEIIQIPNLTIEEEHEGEEIIEALAMGAKDKESLIRKASIEGLGQFEQAHEKALAILNEAIKDESYVARISAVRGISRIARLRGEWQRGLLTVANDNNSAVREALMQTLGLLKPHADIMHVLYKGMRDENDWVRVRAIESLGKLAAQDKTTINKLLAALEDPYAWVRQAAITVLAKVDYPEERVYALLTIQQDEDSRVRDSARLGLEGYKANGIRVPTFFTRNESRSTTSNDDTEKLAALSHA